MIDFLVMQSAVLQHCVFLQMFQPWPSFRKPRRFTLPQKRHLYTSVGEKESGNSVKPH